MARRKRKRSDKSQLEAPSGANKLPHAGGPGPSVSKSEKGKSDVENSTDGSHGDGNEGNRMVGSDRLAAADRDGRGVEHLVCSMCEVKACADDIAEHSRWVHSGEKRITKAEINQLPLFSMREARGSIVVIETVAQMRAACASMAKAVASGSLTAVGFDTEWRPNFRKGAKPNPVALVQITRDDYALTYLFPVGRLRTLGPLIPLFEEPRLTKYAVGVASDLHKLRQQAQFTPAGFVDISTMASDVGFTSVSLRGLVALIFGLRIGKGAQMSNWAAWPLKAKQISYAAADSFCSLHLGRFFDRSCLYRSSLYEASHFDLPESSFP
ncbi:3'-5' exonuclease [Thecamonas trahens ATCC 50062]|uniref:3'-5' exonuclease n=1 Tax=Thecamonas trahens ATCC 50062 TaxID=461836 RepID=A0A0L0DGB1_THETB|nr:3'-5' exonuclease [Thecamonas trahens ATCC 50062]KNC51220.1 3'-5' exonuclease [Thecamonas trahens ATCC 50062]|eukprot:XP_013756417.1 3'-5' exonuclease [Thecamonas trahens ATCC 50062]